MFKHLLKRKYHLFTRPSNSSQCFCHYHRQ